MYAPSSYDDEKIEFYEDVERAMQKVWTQSTIVMDNFNATVWRKQKGEEAIGNTVKSRASAASLLWEI